MFDTVLSKSKIEVGRAVSEFMTHRLLEMSLEVYMRQYKGSCHCGQVSFEVEGDLEEAMECNCSHCSRKGYLLWFVPRADLTLNSPESGLSTYTFNKHVIKHHFCPKCGCAPFGFGADRAGAETAAINVRCLEEVDLSNLKKVPVDGRSL